MQILLWAVGIVALIVCLAMWAVSYYKKRTATPDSRRAMTEATSTNVAQSPNQLRSLWRRIRGDQPFQIWTRGWGTGPLWFYFWGSLLIFAEIEHPGSMKSVLFGWDRLTAGWYIMHVGYLIVLGTWGSWGGEGARLIGTWLVRGLVFSIAATHFLFLGALLRLPFAGQLYGIVGQFSSNSTYTTPAHFEPYVGSPASGQFIAGVVPQGKAPTGWKMQRICDLKPGENIITITEVNGRIRADGRYTRYEGGQLLTDVYNDKKWESLATPDEESPLRLAVGNRPFLIAGPGEIKVKVTKSTPLYAYIEAEEGGSGIVQVHLTVKSG